MESGRRFYESRESGTGDYFVLLGNMNPVTVLRDDDAETVMQAVAARHDHAGARFFVGTG